MLATTPNIGCAGYPLAKPRNVGNLMHIFHHVGDISNYRKHSLDNYDSVILAGDFQRKSIRALEQQRGLPAKSLIALGLPYLDDLRQWRPLRESAAKERKTILVGSSWGSKGCLRTYGTAFIQALAQVGFEVIVRPHPQSALTEPDFIRQCKQETQSALVRWDEEVSPAQAMHDSHLLISDTSSLRFDYAFLYEKPIITLEVPKENLSEFEADDLEDSWYDDAASRIGAVVSKDEIGSITEIVSTLLKKSDSRTLAEFRNATLVNFGNSAPFIVEHIKTLDTVESV
jgi:CDP-glycerol glycerophosphotransferase (TagB/SpsB family)